MSAAVLSRPTPSAVSSAFHCTRCGRRIFGREDLIEEVELWDLGEYRARAFAVRRLHEEESLSRYDASLHEGWYCCRFIAMRMVVDKFGTGDRLLVYVDSVAEASEGEPVPTHPDAHAPLRLGARDFDPVIAAAENRDRLLWVKLGAIWCPPCRLMDSVITRIEREGGLDGVRFFEVDVDESPDLAARFPSRAVPYSVFFYNGQQVRLEGAPFIDGGFVGGLGRAQVIALARRALAQARAT